MEKEDVFNAYNLFQVPEMDFESTKKNKKVIIGIIDASGSMGSYWAAMVKFWNDKIAPQTDILMTFCDKARVEESTFLNQSLQFHGGGMTNILAPFKKLQEEFQKLNKTDSITIIFISDGEDTINGQAKLSQEMLKLKGGQGRDITFLCLGIQSGFPTKISMQLRELYHTGDETLPAVYLIEYASEKAFFNKFETMSKCFKASNTIQIDTQKYFIKEYPWQKNGQADIKEGKWLMVHKEFSNIETVYNGTQHINLKIPSLKEISLEDFVDCLRGWVQKVQLLSMDNSKMEETQKIAASTFETMKNYTLQYEKLCNIFIITESKDNKQSFKDRAMGLAVKNTGSRIKWYLDELAIIAKGLGIGKLNEYDAAKRLGIGTITGKYHQKALALKGITVKDFLEIKNEFAEVFKKVKLSEESSKQEGSIFTLQNQKEVFQEPDFLEGLEFCKSQYDLVETFPIVGYSLKIKRYDGSMINPWKVRLQSLAKTHKSIDSMYLARNSNKYELSIGEDQKEEINAVLPLFYKEDAEMSELFNTRLFKLAVSFMVVQNIDTYHEQAYLALLGAVYVFLLKQQPSAWRTELIDQIYSSLKVTYGATQQFQKLIESIQENPFKLWEDKGKSEHVDIVKILIMIFYISREGRISKQKLNHLVDLALVHYCEKTYVENEFKIFRVCELQVDDGKEQGKQKEISVEHQKEEELKQLGLVNKLKNDDDLKVVVDQKMSKFVKADGIKLIFSDKIFLQEDQDRRVCYSHISNFYEMLTGNKLDKNEKQILFYFGHYLKGTTEQNYSKPIVKDIQDLQKTILTKVSLKDFGLQQGKQFKKLKKSIEEKYLDHFRATHFGILPMTKAKLKSECEKLNINFNSLSLNESTGMVQNACLSPHCVYYLLPMKPAQLLAHLRLWRGQMPARFHMTVSNLIRQKKTPEEICEIVFKSNLVNFKKHHKSQEFVKNYIREIEKALTQK